MFVQKGKGAPTTLRVEYDALAASGRLYLDVLGEDIPHSALGDLMRGADVYVSPYRAEGFNLPVLEAAACGLPLVVTKGGPTDEFTHKSFTKYVEAERVLGGLDKKSPLSIHLEPNADALADAIKEALGDRAWRRDAARAAASWVLKMRYTWKDVAKEHLELMGFI